MSSPAPSARSKRLEAILPLVRAWLMGIASALLPFVEGARRPPRWQRALVFWLERSVTRWLFVSASLRVTLPPLMRARAYPQPTPPGFRRVRTRGLFLQRFARLPRTRAPLAARLAQLIEIARDPARQIARLVKRLAKLIARGGAVCTRLIAIAPPALTLSGATPDVAPAFADSS